MAGRGYNDLLSIIKEDRQARREEDAQGIEGTHGLMSCPNDGSLLNFRARDSLWSCPMGDYTTHRGPRGPVGQ